MYTPKGGAIIHLQAKDNLATVFDKRDIDFANTTTGYNALTTLTTTTRSNHQPTATVERRAEDVPFYFGRESSTLRYVRHTDAHMPSPYLLDISPDANYMAIGSFMLYDLVIVKRGPKTGELGERLAGTRIGPEDSKLPGVAGLAWGSEYQ